jgi:hypothetical protein
VPRGKRVCRQLATRISRILWIAAAVAASEAALQAQTGEITGIVSDPAGAAIPGV